MSDASLNYRDIEIGCTGIVGKAKANIGLIAVAANAMAPPGARALW
jgi:hypothetical protein